MSRFLSDLISKDEIKTWNNENDILITTQTGTGKSYFVLNTLLDYAKGQGKKILLLVPRISIKKQLETALNKTEKNIRIETYQWLEKRLLRKANNLSYDYIVSDEAHYFVHESSFNKNTWHSWRWIMQQEGSVRLFLSATPNLFLPLLKQSQRELKVYQHSMNMDNVSSVQFIPIYDGVQRYNAIREKLKEILLTNEKAIVFMGSIIQGAELYREFREHSLFLCSESQKDYVHLMEQNSIEYLIDQQRFKEQILFTTSVLEYGITIADTEVKHIFYDGYYEDGMIQSVGRKRKLESNDKATLYLAEPNKRVLNGALQNALKDVDSLSQFITSKDKNIGTINAMYDSLEEVDIRGVSLRTSDDSGFELDINPLTLIKLKKTIEETQWLIEQIDNDSYYITMAKRFGLESWTRIKTDKQAKDNSAYLSNIVNKRIYLKAEKDTLAKNLNLRNDKNRLLKSNTKINERLLELNVPYRIVAKRDYSRKIIVNTADGNNTIENPNYKKTYWIVQDFGTIKES